MRLKTLIVGLVLAVAAGPLAAQPLRILAFGDSLTEGHGLPRDSGLVPQLQDWLRQRGHDVEVVNGGGSGDTTAAGLKRLGSWLDREQPDAVIVELGGNDIITDEPPATAEKNLDAILTQAGAGGRPLLLVGIASPYLSPELTQEWAAIWPRLAQRHGTGLVQNLYEPFFEMPDKSYLTMLQPDQTHANAEGVKLIIDRMGPRVEEMIAKIPPRPE